MSTKKGKLNDFLKMLRSFLKNQFTFCLRLAALVVLSATLSSCKLDDNRIKGQFGSSGVTPLAPTGWTMASPVNSTISSDNSPQILGSGLSAENGNTSRVYDDSLCTNQIGSSVISNGTFTVSNITYAADGSDDNSLLFYGKIDNGREASDCTNLFLGYQLDRTSPSIPSGLSLGAVPGNLTETPVLTWTGGTDSGSGIFEHQIQIHLASDDSIVQAWGALASGNQVTGLITLTSSTNYYVKVRAVDNVGNVSAEVQSSNWTSAFGVGRFWGQEAYLKAANAESSDWFGFSIAISDDTVAVGAYGEDSNQTTITNGTGASADNSASFAGAVYVYKRTGTIWAQEAYLKAANAETGDQFGSSVVISGDTMAVGAYQEASNQTTITNGTGASADNSASSAGAVYVYKRTGTTWTQEAYLKATNAASSDYFGYRVALSGDTVAVGAYREDSNQTTITNGTGASADNSALDVGAVYVYKRTGTTWAQEAYLKAANAESGDYFGSSVALSGDTVVVGAYQEDSNQTTITNGTGASADNSAGAAGAVYVYKRTGITWAQEAYLKAANAESDDRFGSSVALSGDTVVVGAHQEASNQTTITNGTGASADNSIANGGAVYVYKRTGTTWVQEAYLKAANAETNDRFGHSVAIVGDTVAVGAYGEDSNQTTITNGIGASADNSTADAGAVYVYKRTGITWAREAYLKAANAEGGDRFGYRIAITGGTVVVGAYRESSNQATITNGTGASADNSASGAGAVYVYKLSNSNPWAQESYLKAANAESGDFFGSRIALSGDTVAVGAYAEDSNQTTITNGTGASVDNSASAAGAVYIYKRTGTTWAQEAYLKAANVEIADFFGSSVALSGDTVAVGAYEEDSNQTTITNGTGVSVDNSALAAGAVYVYKRTGTTWAQEAYLKAANAESNDNFGYSVAIVGDTVAVGAYTEDSNQTTITNGTGASADNSVSFSGAVYVYKRTGTTWAQEAYLKAANAESSGFFGSSVALSGDTVAVGAYGEASNQTTITNGTGASADNSAALAGAVYVYKRTGTTWAQEAYLKAANAESSDRFGSSVALSGDTVAVGTAGEDSNQTIITNGIGASADNSANSAGAVYVYKRTGTTWAQEAYLKAANAESNDHFGHSVALSGDIVAVGANMEDSNQTTITNGTGASVDNSASAAGAVYVYKRTGTTWVQEAYLKASNAESNDNFGHSVAIVGGTVAVGAYEEDSNQTTITNGTGASADNSATSAGAVYIYKK